MYSKPYIEEEIIEVEDVLNSSPIIGEDEWDDESE